jgi:hypothetical protein
VLLQLVALLCLVITSLLFPIHPPLLIVIFGYLFGLPSIHFAIQKNSFVLANVYGTCCVLLGIFPSSFSLYKLIFRESSTIGAFHIVLIAECLVVVLLNTIGALIAKSLMVLWQPKPPRDHKE